MKKVTKSNPLNEISVTNCKSDNFFVIENCGYYYILLAELESILCSQYSYSLIRYNNYEDGITRLIPALNNLTLILDHLIENMGTVYAFDTYQEMYKFLSTK